MKKVSIIVLIIGFAALIFAGFTYKKAADIRVEAMAIEKVNQSFQKNLPSVNNDTQHFLSELSPIMHQPNVTVDDINNFIVEKFGPCWGIPEGQCRE
jgi:hypothetical protein